MLARAAALLPRLAAAAPAGQSAAAATAARLLARSRPAAFASAAPGLVRPLSSAAPLLARVRSGADQPADQRNEADAHDRSEGMDLFAQAMAAQKRQEQQSQNQQQPGGQQPGSEPPTQEEIDAERMRRRTEAGEAEDSKRRNDNAAFYSVVAALSLLGMYGYMGMPSEEHPKQEGESFFGGHNRRVAAYIIDSVKYWTEPTTKKLLPDPIPEMQPSPFTLLVEHNDALTHLVWDKDAGWRVAVRPGAREFLANLRKYYEVVIFTNVPGHLAQPVIDSFDPMQYATYRLYRDHTTLDKGMHVKDLSILNRDLNNVIILDTRADNFRLQPENGFVFKAWHGEPHDTELTRISHTLDELALLLITAQIKDVRPILKTLRDYSPDLPEAWAKFKDTLRKNAAAKSAREEQAAREAESAAAQQQQSVTIADMIERLAREERDLLPKQMDDDRKHLEKIMRMQKEMVEKQSKENKDKKLTMYDAMMGAGQVSPEEMQAVGLAAAGPESAK
nr:mitochondrial inner membrane protein required for protein import [Polyrhizophydium stewartii]